MHLIEALFIWVGVVKNFLMEIEMINTVDVDKIETRLSSIELLSHKIDLKLGS